MSDNIPTDRVDLGHHLQRSILMRLRQNGPASYRQLKPDGVEGNAYNYHLRNLKKSGLIVRDDDRYVLTATGYLVVDAFSLQNQRLMLRPHMYTLLLVTAGDQILLYQHARPPLAGALGLLSGKVHYGDDFKTSIAREARRRNVSDDYDVRMVCPVSVRYAQGTEIVLHRPGVLWHLDYRGPLKTRRTENGVSRWIARDEAEAMPECLAEVREALMRLDDGQSDAIDIRCEL